MHHLKPYACESRCSSSSSSKRLSRQNLSSNTGVTSTSPACSALTVSVSIAGRVSIKHTSYLSFTSCRDSESTILPTASASFSSVLPLMMSMLSYFVRQMMFSIRSGCRNTSRNVFPFGLAFVKNGVKFVCGSASIKSTFFPNVAMLYPKLTALVVFPTPPFKFTITYVLILFSFHPYQNPARNPYVLKLFLLFFCCIFFLTQR